MQKRPKVPITNVQKDSERDLGLGSILTNESSSRFLNRDGTFNVQRTGINKFSKINLYHWLLTIKWRKFLGITITIFLGINVLFAVTYLMCGNNSLADTSIEPTNNTFLRAFFFSVQTFATIGYGTLHPNGLAANFF